MLVFLTLGDAKVLSFALGDAKVPNARYFAFWWNTGLRFLGSDVIEITPCYTFDGSSFTNLNHECLASKEIFFFYKAAIM